MTIYDAMTRVMGNDFGHGWLAVRPLLSHPKLRQYNNWLLKSQLVDCSQWIHSTPVPQAAYSRTLDSTDDATRRTTRGLGP